MPRKQTTGVIPILLSIAMIVGVLFVLNWETDSSEVTNKEHNSSPTPSTSTSTETSTTPVTPSTSSDNTSDKTSNSVTVTEQQIYDYMQRQFEIVTNYGENYDPDIHDPKVIRLASQHFGMSETEIKRMYTDAAMKQYTR